MAGKILRSRWPQAITFVAFAMVVVIGWMLEEHFLSPPGWQRPLGQLKPGEYTVDRVIDGDTIVLKANQLRVRLQGVDTPETVKPNTAVEPWGPEAREYTTRFLTDANWCVRLEIDGESVDRYGRHLAFVWFNNRLLNEELVMQGLAHAKTTFDFSEPMKTRLRNAQSTAQAGERGIWSEHMQK